MTTIYLMFTLTIKHHIRKERIRSVCARVVINRFNLECVLKAEEEGFFQKTEDEEKPFMN